MEGIWGNVGSYEINAAQILFAVTGAPWLCWLVGECASFKSAESLAQVCVQLAVVREWLSAGPGWLTAAQLGLSP